MKLALPIPDHTTLSRRTSTLDIRIKNKPSSGKPVHLIVDSTGLSVHGEGPWSEHKHGSKKEEAGGNCIFLLTKMVSSKQISSPPKRQVMVVKYQT